MLIHEIQKRVDEIKVSASDDESAHGLQDKLYLDFIEFVAQTADKDLAEKAQLVASVDQIHFSRWYA